MAKADRAVPGRRCTETLRRLARALPRFVARYTPGFLEEVTMFLPPTSGTLWGCPKKPSLPPPASGGGPAAERQSSCNLRDVGSPEGLRPDPGILVHAKGPPASAKDAVEIAAAPSTSAASIACSASTSEAASGSRCGGGVPRGALTDEVVEDCKPKKALKCAVTFSQHPVFLHFYDKRLEREYRRYFASQAASVGVPGFRLRRKLRPFLARM